MAASKTDNIRRGSRRFADPVARQRGFGKPDYQGSHQCHAPGTGAVMSSI